MASCASTSASGQAEVSEIPPWSEGSKDYLVLEKFPSLRKRLETGLECLSSDEREELRKLVRKRESELRATGRPYLTPLHEKVALLAGGNLAQLAVDAVVNASNNWLTAGKAGSCLLEECVSLGGCRIGEAKLTSGYNLPAQHVIHTVGPEGKHAGRAKLLRSCYWSVLELCRSQGIRTVAFPCISTGAYRYPRVEAADVAIATVREWLLMDNNAECIDKIVFVTRKVSDEEAYALLMLTYFPLV